MATSMMNANTTDMTPAMRAIISQYEFSVLKNIRTSMIILAAFNITAALLTASSILYDAWLALRRDVSLKLQRRHSFLSRIHPAEVFPLILSTSIAMQGLVFIGAQATGLSSMTVSSCARIAQVVWPALWIVPYVTIVFGVDTVVRSIKKPRLTPRGKWNVLNCLATVILLLFVTWVPSIVRPAAHHCLADLMSWTAHFALPGTVLLSFLLILLSACASVLFIQLSRTMKIEADERIAATRIVYYILLIIVMMLFTLPYFIQLSLHQAPMNAVHIAIVVLNLTGFANGLLHLFLRCNAFKTAIRPLETPWQSDRPLRMFGGNDLDLESHITSPVTLARSDSHKQLIIGDKKAINTDRRTPDTKSQATCQRLALETPTITINIPPLLQPPPPPRPAVTTSFPPYKRSESNYSLFPTRASEKPRIASSIYSSCSEEPLKPPRPLFLRGHKRESSGSSSATVQIGLRISHAPPMAVAMSSGSSEMSLQLPMQHPSKKSSSGGRSSPLAGRENVGSKTSSDGSPTVNEEKRQRLGGRMKTLPPTPNRLSGLTSHPPSPPPQMKQISQYPRVLARDGRIGGGMTWI